LHKSHKTYKYTVWTKRRIFDANFGSTYTNS